jgi:hypothetical protein
MLHRMPKSRLPDLSISPMKIPCTSCNAKPGEVCTTASGAQLEQMHIARIKAAAAMDMAAKKARRK